MLFLGSPRNGIATKINNECTSRSEIIFVSYPVDLRECMKHERRVTIKNNTMILSTTKIANQSLNNTLMLSGWLLHELRQLYC